MDKRGVLGTALMCNSWNGTDASSRECPSLLTATMAGTEVLTGERDELAARHTRPLGSGFTLVHHQLLHAIVAVILLVAEEESQIEASSSQVEDAT